MNNIFEKSKFGDRYVAKDGSIVILTSLFDDVAYGISLDDHGQYFTNWTLQYRLDGVCLNSGPAFIDGHMDIVSRYKDEIDEMNLSDMAKKLTDEYEKEIIDKFGECNCESIAYYYRGVKAGFKKALKEYV